MNWYYDITWWEYGLVGLFALLYVLFIVRTTRKARQMGTYPSGLAAKAMLRVAYVGLLTVGLLGPTFGSLRKEVKTVGRDIYLVVDLSRSMDATDVAPTRLERAKYEIIRWLPNFASDRIGLIVFADGAFVQCPLTYDQNALRLFIETLRTDLMPRTGTDLAAALRLAVNRHLDRKNTSTRNQAKIILLVSDGEDFGEEAEQMAAQIEENGLRLFTLGVGTRSGTSLSTPSGRRVTTQLKPETLQRLARRANGQYFELSRTQNDVARLVAAVSKVEGQIKDTRQLDVSANKFHYFLIGALMLLAIDIMIAVTTIHL